MPCNSRRLSGDRAALTCWNLELCCLKGCSLRGPIYATASWKQGEARNTQPSQRSSLSKESAIRNCRKLGRTAKGNLISSWFLSSNGMVDELDVGYLLNISKYHGRTARARIIHAMHLERSCFSVLPKPRQNHLFVTQTRTSAMLITISQGQPLSVVCRSFTVSIIINSKQTSRKATSEPSLKAKTAQLKPLERQEYTAGT